MSGMTWARNEEDERVLSMQELSQSFLKTKIRFQEQYGRPLKAVRLSRLTLLSIPLPHANLNPVSTFYGVPIEIDDSLGLWEFKEVHA